LFDDTVIVVDPPATGTDHDVGDTDNTDANIPMPDADTGAHPAVTPVTVTVTSEPMSAAVNAYQLPVAPVIATPSRNH